MIKINTCMQLPKSVICSVFSFCFFFRQINLEKAKHQAGQGVSGARRVYANSHTLLPTQQEVLIEANVSRNVKYTI